MANTALIVWTVTPGELEFQSSQCHPTRVLLRACSTDFMAWVGVTPERWARIVSVLHLGMDSFAPKAESKIRL